MKCFTRLVLACVGILAAGGVARAASTNINAPWPGELSVSSILKATYGDGVIATRVDDSADQIWSGNVISTRALGRFAAYTQGLAFDGGSGPVKQFDVVGSGLSVTGSGGAFSDDSFSIVRTGTKGNQSSVDSANTDGKDHMVTYLIGSADGGVQTYALFFEDWIGANSDFDFNDLAVEMQIGTVAMPLPAPVLMGLIGLGVAGAAKRFARRKA